MTIKWDSVPIVFILPRPRARCPNCSSTDMQIIRVMPRESDGSKSRRCVCNKCSRPCVVVVDPELLASSWQDDDDVL